MNEIFFNKCFECEFCKNITKDYDKFFGICKAPKSKNFNKKINAEGDMCNYRKALKEYDYIIE